MINIKNKGRQLWEFLMYLFDSFYEDRCNTTAAALTYQTLFAVVPMLVIGFFFLGLFDEGEMREKAESLIFSNIVPENAGLVQEYLISFSNQAMSLGGTSIAFVIITAFVMLYTIEKSFNDVWHINEPRHGFQRFLMYWAVLTLAIPVILVSVGITVYAQTLPIISDVAETTQVLHIIPILISSFMFMLMYAVVPNCSVPLKDAFVGGFITGIIFEIAQLLFTGIMAQSNLAAIYGTFAAAPLFLFWIYVLWTIILLGAELVKTLGVYRFDGNHNLEEPLFQIVFLLELFYRAHQQGEIVREADIRAHASRINLEKWTEYRTMLIDLKLVRLVEGGLVLSRDLNEVSIWDLYSKLPWQLPHHVKGDKGWEKKLSECFSVLYQGNKAALEGDLESLFKER